MSSGILVFVEHRAGAVSKQAMKQCRRERLAATGCTL